MPFQTWAANAKLDATLSGSTWPTYATFFGACFSTTLALSNSSTYSGEVTGASYLRQDITAAFGAAADGAAANDVAVEFVTMPATTVYTFGIVTSSSVGGRIVWQSPLTAQKAITAGDTLRFAIGAITGTST